MPRSASRSPKRKSPKRKSPKRRPSKPSKHLPKIYGSYRDGSDIYRDQRGYYILAWNPRTKVTSKRRVALPRV